jgi:tRNA-specific 2-thiouridylase
MEHEPMREPQTRVLVAMSGGVDSSVAAALLMEQGYEVVGAFMRNGVKAGKVRGRGQGCCGVEDALDARRVAERLQVPFYAIDLEDAFEGLISDFVDAYARGDTPNPCIECNRRFKMGALRVLGKRLGAESVATGHYAQIVERGGRLAVERGVDEGKDQPYVLYSLDQES